MALNSIPRRRLGVALGVVLTGVAAGLIGFAGTASAHIYKIEAKCVEAEKKTTLSVKLSSYNGSRDNTIKIVDGEEVLYEGKFRERYDEDFTVAADVAHTFVVTAKAWDGPNNPKWSFTEKRSVEACVTPPPSSEEPPPSSEEPPPSSESSTPPPSEEPPPSSEEPPPSSETTPSSPPSSQPVVETPVTTTTPPVVKEEGLAETGASVGLPLGIGGVLLVGGVVLLFVVKRRSKA